MEQAKIELGDDFVEVPLHGKAGTTGFYDTATYHTRLDSPLEGLQVRIVNSVFQIMNLRLQMVLHTQSIRTMHQCKSFD